MRFIWCVPAVFAAATVAAQPVSAPGSVLSAPGGRFVFGQVSDAARHQYLLDTQTGRLWSIKCIVEDASSADALKSPRCLYQRLDPVFFDDDGAVLPSSSATAVPRTPRKQ